MNKLRSIIGLCLILVAACTSAGPVITHSDLIAYGETVEQPLPDFSQEHHWTFLGNAGDLIDVNLRADGGAPGLILRDQNNVVLEEIPGDTYDETAFLGDVRLPLVGQYTLIVSGSTSGAGRYQLLLTQQNVALAPSATPVAAAIAIPTITPLPATAIPSATFTPTIAPTATPPRITSGEQLEPRRIYEGELTQPGQFDRYTIFGQANEVITVGAIRPSGSLVDPYLELHDPSGEIIATATNTFGRPDAVVVGVTLPVTGAYNVFVRDELAEATGLYQIAFGDGLTMADSMQTNTLPDQVYNGNLTQPVMRDVWMLDLRLGDVISAVAAVDEDSLLIPVLALISPSGQEIRLNDNPDGEQNAALHQVIVPETGQYVLAVNFAEGQESGGSYVLVWRYDTQAATPAPSLTPIPSATPFTFADETVTLSEGAQATLTFEGRAGQNVLIMATGLSDGFDPLLEVYGPDGTLLGEVDDFEGDLNPRLALTLPADGTYRVLVHDYIYAPGTFHFRVIEN